MSQFGFKDFEAVTLKTTYDIELGNRIIRPGEVIAYFDKIQIAGLQEVKNYVTAHGGFDDRPHVFWETTKEMPLTFSQGVFSKDQLAILSNSRMITSNADDPVSIPMREYLETGMDGTILCKYEPARDTFVYNAETGEKVNFTQSGNVLQTTLSFTEVIVDYEFNYTSDAQILRVGDRLINGFLTLTGKTRIKDDTTGRVVTGLIKIPHLKLMSNLSIRLGAQANPVVANFNAIGVPVGSRGSSYVSELYFLSDDIESDL